MIEKESMPITLDNCLLKFVLFAAGLGCAAPPSHAAGPATPPLEVVSVGVFTVAPYVIAGPNGPSGVLIDFFDREVAPRMGVRFKWERPVTIARLEQSLIGGIGRKPVGRDAMLRLDQPPHGAGIWDVVGRDGDRIRHQTCARKSST